MAEKKTKQTAKTEEELRIWLDLLDKSSPTYGVYDSFGGNEPLRGAGNPSILYVNPKDNKEIIYYHIRGIEVPKWIVDDPQSITAKNIDAESSAEVRRIMLRIFGEANFLLAGNYQVLDQDVDQYGRLRQLLQKDLKNDDPILQVKVTNSTPEWNSEEFKFYMLPVQHECRPMKVKLNKDLSIKERLFGDPQKLTCHNAVASTFGKRGEEYNPGIET